MGKNFIHKKYIFLFVLTVTPAANFFALDNTNKTSSQASPSANDYEHFLYESGQYRDTRHNLNNTTEDVNEKLMEYIEKHYNPSIDEIKTAINHGADVNYAREDGTTPLHLAAKSRGDSAASLVNFLIEKGAYVNAKDNDGYTPLLLAANMANPKPIKKLIEHGADVNASTKKGETSLHMAAKWGYEEDEEEIIKILLEARDINVNANKVLGFTPLHFAVFGQNPETIQILLENDADKTIKNENGDTAFDLAKIFLDKFPFFEERESFEEMCELLAL